jgi:formate--tetrahydrofolate ligase
MHGGVAKADLSKPDCAALEKGFENLKTHIENIAKFGLPAVVAVNKFITDTDEEIALLQKLCQGVGSTAVLSEGWGKGGEGAEELARAVSEIADSGKADYHPLYELDLPLEEKIKKIATEIYRADGVEFEGSALKKLRDFEAKGYGKLPVCIAKTQNSISHDPKLIGAPRGVTFPVRDVQLYAGAGFVVALAGDIMTMPGLPKAPAALDIDVDDNGVISGLF